MIAKQLINFIDNSLWPEQRIYITDGLKKLIAGNNIVIADIGAAGGVESRWSPIRSLIKFVCFEPDKRSYNSSADENLVTFPVGLGAQKGTKLLNLASSPTASSLYVINSNKLKSYANFEGHTIVASVPIELDTLDNCLSEHPELMLDFIKSDVEGADLDVLKGATKSLQNVKGIRVEVSFMERFIDEPLFGEVDAFLRQHGFELFILSREHWLRRNLTYGANSYPQLVWADAVYFLTLERVIERLSHLSKRERELDVAKYVVLLICYGAHDYAMEIVASTLEKDLISSEIAEELRQSIRSSVDNLFFDCIRRSIAVLFALSCYIIFLPVKPARKMGRKYLRKHLSLLTRSLSHIGSRGGINDSCLYDI